MNRLADLIRIVSPILYAATVPVVFAVALAAVISVESTVGLHTWVRVGDIDAGVGLLVGGVLVFVPATVLLRRADHPADAIWLRHFRHSAVLYAIALLLAASLIARFEHHNGLLYGYTAMLFLATCFGIAMNASTHWFMARRHRHLEAPVD